MGNKPSYKKYFLFFILPVVIVGLIFLDKKGVLDKPKSIIYSFTTPAEGFSHKTSSRLSGFTKDLFSFSTLRSENEELELINETLLSENVRLREVVLENDFLRKQLGVYTDDGYSLKLASIVNLNMDNGRQKTSINKGARDNIKIGSAVVTSGNIFIGQVDRVYENRSDIILINDPQISVPVLLQEERSQGIIHGEHGIGVVLDFIPLESGIKENEKVLTLGTENTPHGLLVGRVREVNNQDDDLFKKATINPIAELNSMEKVFVMVK